MTGPALRFRSNTVVALTGADMQATLDGVPAPYWQALQVRAGSVLRMGAAGGPGSRAYVAFRGGLDVPEYLGSRSTFILGKFGGHSGRTLQTGDVLRWRIAERLMSMTLSLPEGLRPQYSDDWEIGVLYGPHGSPDFFTRKDVDAIFDASWKVHYNSDRTGVRLIGPRPGWARKDGGEAGLHPSNIHDNAYAVGGMDFTGDMPILLGPDGPSLGGFVCPAVIAQAELWKMGQLRAGNTVRFRRISNAQAERLEWELDNAIASLRGTLPEPVADVEEPAILHGSDTGTVYRAAGDRYLLIEVGSNELNLDLRMRVFALEQALRRERLRGIVDITPGIRSLQIHYDSRVLHREELIACLDACDQAVSTLGDISFPARNIHLPLSWEDPATLLAIQKYTQSVRADAPWCPSNIEFIRRINGLESVEDVRDIVYSANYLVLGLGDVYLGAPVATPIDPRHRLVTTKYNPARTWTAENSVGIGGAYMCIYGMEGPGGYQFVGRTLQMWNTYRSTAEFEHGSPWLLRFFDQIRFFPVTAAELLEIRDAFPHDKYSVDIEHTEFSVRNYRTFLRSIKDEAAQFKHRQEAAFLAERERWAAAGQPEFVDFALDSPTEKTTEIPEGCEAVRSPMAASIWHVAVEPGQPVEAGQKLLVLEAMKMEVTVVAPNKGVVELVHCAKGGMVTAGQNLATLRVS
jgi:urea carboxylase